MNTGPYTTYQRLLLHLYPSVFVSYKSAITLSNKAGNVFEYTGNSFALAVGDIITQGEYAQRVSALQTTPNRITLDDGTDFINASAYAFRSTKTIDELNTYRAVAMQTIDLYTGQWFNARSFSSINPIRYEGNNTRSLYFPVPIIDVTSMKINNETTDMDPNLYVVHNSRAIPDDRRNPRVQLVSQAEDTIFRGQNDAFFYQGYFTLIEGTFGFVEQDGSTPEAIQWATCRLVALAVVAGQTPTSLNQVTKREKTDLHEIEYETTSETSAEKIQALMTGDVSVDRILIMFKAPLAIAGSTPSVFKEYYSSAEYYSNL